MTVTPASAYRTRTMCATPYERVYWNFHQQISAHSVSAAMLLDELHERHGVEVAFYAAFVILWLEKDLKDRVDASYGGMNTFTFFQVARANADAQTLLSDALECYLTDTSIDTSR